MTPPRSTVALVRCPDYSRAEVERAVARTIELLGGISQFVRPGDGVLLKPNLLSANAPDAAVTTHPELVRAVALAAQNAGGEVAIGDSPGIGSLSAVAEKAGLGAVARELGIPLRVFDEPADVQPLPGAKFRKLALARATLDAPVLINLPKVKTHQQMFLSLAVKNLFGCVVGKQKVAWHLTAGRDAALFARVLVEIACTLRPALSIADGVVGMEGAGPSHGTPRPFGFIAGSADPFALDLVLTELLGFTADEVPVLAAAREARLDGLDAGPAGLDEIDVVGDGLAALRPRHVRPPATGRLMFVPDFIARPLRRFVTVRPAIRRSLCRACGLCVESCPARAMKIVDRRVKIDDTSCIRCFCCQELCPHGAVRARRGFLTRFFST